MRYMGTEYISKISPGEEIHMIQYGRISCPHSAIIQN
jgi:hypothetical protein